MRSENPPRFTTPTELPMATYFLAVQSISRKDGRSLPACSAYRSGSSVFNFRTGERHDYRRRSGVLASVLLTPADAPPDWTTREKIFSEAEHAEKRKDSVVGREVWVALPWELSEDSSTRLALRLGEWIVNRFGVVVEVSVHAPSQHGSEKNVHAHLLFTSRVLRKEGFAEKTRQLDRKNEASVELEILRGAWCELLNQSLAENGVPARLDHRSYERQGISKIGEPKLGPAQSALERRGVCTQSGDERRRIRNLNEAVARCERQIQREKAPPALGIRIDSVQPHDKPSPGIRRNILP
jgi:hypothetical protein